MKHGWFGLALWPHLTSLRLSNSPPVVETTGAPVTTVAE